MTNAMCPPLHLDDETTQSTALFGEFPRLLLNVTVCFSLPSYPLMMRWLKRLESPGKAARLSGAVSLTWQGT